MPFSVSDEETEAQGGEWLAQLHTILLYPRSAPHSLQGRGAGDGPVSPHLAQRWRVRARRVLAAVGGRSGEKGLTPKPPRSHTAGGAA